MWDGQVTIETWYLKITFDNIFLLMKHEIFLKSTLNLRTNQKLHSRFQDL